MRLAHKQWRKTFDKVEVQGQSTTTAVVDGLNLREQLTAAGPSRIHTGVPCSRAAKHGSLVTKVAEAKPNATHRSGQALSAVHFLSVNFLSDLSDKKFKDKKQTAQYVRALVRIVDQIAIAAGDEGC